MRLDTINTDVQLHIFRFLEFSDWSSVSLVCTSFNSFLDTTYRASELIKQDVEKYYLKKESEFKQLRESEAKILKYNRKVFLYFIAGAVCYSATFHLSSKLPGELAELFDFDEPSRVFKLAMAGIGTMLSLQYYRPGWNLSSNLFSSDFTDTVITESKKVNKIRRIKDHLMSIRRVENQKKGNPGIFNGCGDNKKSSSNEEKRARYFPWLHR